MPNNLPLGTLKRKANTVVPISGVNTRHVRTMFWARPIGRGFKARKAKDKANEFFIHEGAQHKAAIMNNGNQQMCGDDIRFTARPDFTLKHFDGGHFFDGFQQTDIPSGHS
jgi:hypothetical protein